MTPEAKARQTIDALLTAAGWQVCHLAEADIAERGRWADSAKFEDADDLSPRGWANRLAYFAQVHFGLTLASIDASNRRP